MPIPGPSNSHFRRSLGDPSAKRGYHARGTDTTRPSRSSTTRARSVTRTFLAVAISVATLEVVMPCLRECSRVFPQNPRNSVQFCLTEPIVVRYPNGCKPEFGELVVPLDVNVNWLVTITREKEKPIRSALQNSRAHRAGFCQPFRNRCQLWFQTTMPSSTLRSQGEA